MCSKSGIDPQLSLFTLHQATIGIALAMNQLAIAILGDRRLVASIVHV